MKYLHRKRLNPSNSVFTGIQKIADVSINLIEYDKEQYHEFKEIDLESVDPTPLKKVHWLNVTGIHDAAKVKRICELFNIHPLVIEDILDVYQRNKFQAFDDYWFFSVKSINPPLGESLNTEHLSFILSSNYLVSFQEVEADHFDHVRERIKQNLGIVRQRGTDYLMYLLLEAIMEGYFKTLETIDDEINDLQLTEPKQKLDPTLLSRIELRRRQVNTVKKMVLPLKEFAVLIENNKPKHVQEKHLKYYAELKDITLTLLDECDKLDMRLDSNINLYFSVQDFKMNQVMKTLTIVATIFIPLTFIAGIYGMNFKNMPELDWPFGYAMVLLIMLAAAGGMLVYFKRKDWF